MSHLRGQKTSSFSLSLLADLLFVDWQDDLSSSHSAYTTLEQTNVGMSTGDEETAIQAPQTARISVLQRLSIPTLSQHSDVFSAI